MAEKNDVLERLGITEERLQTMMNRRSVLGMRRRFTVVVPFSVYCAFQELVERVKSGELSKEAADSQFDQRIRPHFGKMPDGFSKERGDLVQFDYPRSAPRVVLPS